jgi:stearoyl-CoA desaturase (delta-9 desaturase)
VSNTTKLIINHIICHIALIPAVIYGEIWMWIGAFLWWYIIAIVSISGGYHRYYSHKAFKAGKVYEFFVNFLGIFSGAGPALSWAATHIQHHVYSDSENDPHSYKHKGVFAVYCNTWGYGFQIKRKFVKKLLKRKELVWWMKNYFKVNIAIVLTLILIDPMLFVFGYAVPIVFAFHGYGLLNILGHLGNKPTNTWIGNILTAGEGWHANHHKKPGSIAIGETRWQFDPTKYFCNLIKEK